jgi:hypothetical protein
VKKKKKKQSNMVRSPKEVNKGAWSREEDDILSKYVVIHGEGKWQKVAQNAGALIFSNAQLYYRLPFNVF